MTRTSRAQGVSGLLEHIRWQRRMTKTEFAKTVGTGRPYMANVTNGVHIPSAAWLNMASEALGLTEEQRRNLHRAAARDNGYEIDLT